MNGALEALREVYQEALETGRRLLQYAETHYDPSACQDPERLGQILDGREELIQALAAQDAKASTLLRGLADEGQALPEYIKDLQKELRDTLDAVRRRDEALAEGARASLEALKTRTLKARESGKIARYLGETPQTGRNIDLSR